MTETHELISMRNRLLTGINEIDNVLSSTWISNAATWKAKAVSCIAINKHFMTTIDILVCVLGTEQFKKIDDDIKRRKEMVSLLSVTLSNLVREGYINKARLKGFKGHYYGLKSWFESDGRMKPEYADQTLYFLLNEEVRSVGCCNE